MSELQDHFTIRFDGEDREIFMSFGLLRDLHRTFPNPQDPAQVLADPVQFENCLWLLLVPRSKTGKLQVETFDMDDHEVETDQMIDLVKWALEHLMRFFLTKLGKLPRLGEESTAQMEVLLSAFPGLKASASTKPSAGPTANSEANSASSTSA